MSVFLARRGDIQQGAKTNPSFRAVSTATPGFNTSQAINKPTGTIDGDRIVIGVGVAGSAGTSTPAISGFTNLGTQTLGSGTITLFTKIASGEGASWTVTGLSSSRVTSIAAITVKDGNGTISSVVTNATGAGGAASITTAAIPTTEDGATIVKFVNMEEVSGGSSMTATWTTITERADIQASGSGGGMTCATEDQPTAGAGNTRLCAVTGTTPQLIHVGIAVY